MTKFPAQFASLDEAVLPARPLHLAIGMFDGVHLGHRAVIGAAVAAAKKSGGLSGVMTFSPHPSALFRTDSPTRLLYTPAAKTKVLFALGVDLVITQPFDRALAGIEAADFLPWLRQRLPALTAIYVGENFRFGRGRAGDVTLLIQSGRQRGVEVHSAGRVLLDGEPVSSTRVRRELETGAMPNVNALLGRSYTAEGVVTPGKQLGRTIGFPTLNVPWSPEFRPRLGVYAVRVSSAAHPEPRPGVANYGLRPTVEQASEPRLEVNVLGECPFGPGDAVTVEWLHFLRPERKFAGLEELRAQIAQDREEARRYFAART
jgi:riboflavin kinase/FMN adenylyltransferase